MRRWEENQDNQPIKGGIGLHVEGNVECSKDGALWPPLSQATLEPTLPTALHNKKRSSATGKLLAPPPHYGDAPD